MSGLIIEGICASGKSIIFQGLSKQQKYIQKENKIQLNEYLTERIIENTNPSIEMKIELLEGYVGMFEKIHNNFYDSRFKNKDSLRTNPYYLVERFHLTHSIESEEFMKFKEIDNKLSKIGFKLIILIMNKDVIRERIEDTFSRIPKTWYNYIMSFGGIEEVVTRYKRMQERLLQYSRLTSLPIIIEQIKLG